MNLSRSFLLCALLTTLGATARAQEWTTEPIGRTAVLRMDSAPFPHPSSPQYTDDRVLMFVPRGYTPGPLVDVVVHYHGQVAETVSSVKARRLREQLAASGRSAVLIAPQGPLRAAHSAGGKHEDEGGLQRFLDEAVAALVRDGLAPRGARVGRVILSGHSGGYLPIARSLEHGGVEVSEVWLHDAVYEDEVTFAAWASQRGHRLVSTHTGDGGTRRNNAKLKRELEARGVPVVVADANIQNARAAILAVPESHNEATRHFERFLRTSGLGQTARAGASPPPRGNGIIGSVPR
jgi:hypothetical protein